MTDAAMSAPIDGDQTQDGRTAPILFALAVFASAALIFAVQPMATKLILPTLGGSPAVWNTAMVFFQAALLVGYGYAHLLQRIGSLKTQVAVHLVLLLAAGMVLPLRISGLLGDPDPAAPAWWLLGTLTLSIGAPFAVLSATAPLLQAWFARVRAGRPDGANPYVLYAASNAGSFLSLLAYPVLIEPLMSLTGQRMAWSAGYALFLILIAALAFVVGRGRLALTAAEPAPLERSAPIPLREKAIWVGLAALPSSLMLGATSYLSTDVASAPFLWVIPLALYLLTFVIAFSGRPWIPLPVTLVFQAGFGAIAVAMVAFRTGDWWMLFGLHIAAFFFSTLMCHQMLARRRPPPDRLTEFYLLMSLGGVIGGALTALLAPVVFNTVAEYPLALVLVGLARPWSWREVSRTEIALFLVALLLALTPPLALEIMRYKPEFRAVFSNVGLITTAQVVLLGAAAAAFLVRDRAIFFTLALAAIVLSGLHIARGYDWKLTERSFFGVVRVAETRDDRLGGPVHVLMHGTTLHGAQPLNPAFACMPTLYYAPATPIGQAAMEIERRGPAVIGVVGQGSGAMAGYKRAEDRLTFFEIDPQVNALSRDPRWFSFIDGCAQGPVRTVLGDARLTMAREPAGTYDLLVIDAFTSDAVPTHLLTEEAIAGYLRLLKPDGVVLLHLSNRNLDITRPTVAAARALEAPFLHQLYAENPSVPDMAEASTEALILSPTEAGLAPFRADGRWETMPTTGVRPWTDDYVNLFGALYRNLKAKWEWEAAVRKAKADAR